MEEDFLVTNPTGTSPTQSTAPSVRMQHSGTTLRDRMNLDARGRMFTTAEETIPDSTPKKDQSKASNLIIT